MGANRVLPSSREKKRYLTFEVISLQKSLQKPQFASIAKAITDSMQEFVGSIGIGNSGMQILEHQWNEKTSKGIIRVNNLSTDNVKTALTFIKSIDKTPVIIQSVKTSGMLHYAINEANKIVIVRQKDSTQTSNN